MAVGAAAPGLSRRNLLRVPTSVRIRAGEIVCGAPPIRIRAKLGALGEDKVTRLKEILVEHPGDSPVFVHLESPEKTTVIRLGDEHLVSERNGLFAELRVLLGPDCIV